MPLHYPHREHRTGVMGTAHRRIAASSRIPVGAAVPRRINGRHRRSAVYDHKRGERDSDALLITVTATAAIPVSIFGWMMGVAALALITNGESPRAVLAMPRTIFRRCELPIHSDSIGD